MIKATSAVQYGNRWEVLFETDLPCDVKGYYERRADGAWTINIEWYAQGNSIRLVQLAPDGSAGAYFDLAVARLNAAVDTITGPQQEVRP